MAMRPARCGAHREMRFKIQVRGEDVQLDARKLECENEVSGHTKLEECVYSSAARDQRPTGERRGINS